MIHLKYIDNPFKEEVFHSISCFSLEKSFYDCINRRFLKDESFENLGNTFYMYMLTGQFDEWIGYVLFSNADRINSYKDYAYQNYLQLFNALPLQYLTSSKCHEFVKEQKEFIKDFSLSELDNMTKNIMNTFSIPTVSKKIESYYLDLQSYLESFPDYFYLDVVIALPKEEEANLKREFSSNGYNINLLVENKYYGFIQETLKLVEDKIEESFIDIPIFLRKDDKSTILVNRNLKKTLKPKKDIIS